MINLGAINFTNCLPVNYPMYKWAFDRLIMKEGYPVLINQLMRDKKIHAGPISSIEYIKNSDKYTLIEGPCISSDGEVGSVMLFSSYDFEDLEGKTVGVPYTSSSSTALLKILLDKHGLDLSKIKFQVHKYESSLIESLNGQYDAILYIGDPALISNVNHKKQFKIYDLGKMWKEFTGYPMVFGTWVAWSDWAFSQKDDFEWLCFILDKAVDAGLNIYLNEIINIASNSLKLDKTHIEDYLTCKINYKFTERHKKSLKLFESLYNNLNRVKINDK